MKKLSTLLAFLIWLFALQTIAQEKEPIATDDYYEVLALEPIVMDVLANDWAYENHPVKIMQVQGNTQGEFSFNDSLMFYTPPIYYAGVDSVSYRITDLVNGLLSTYATVYITVENKGFDFLNINEISCRINSFGNHFWDGIYSPQYEVPKNSGVNSVWMNSMLIGGFDDSGTLRMAGERYRISGVDFFPGPVMDSTAYCNEQDMKWNRVWKLSYSDIRYHQQHWQDAGYEPIPNIAQWPGNGNTALGAAQQLAPYDDVNGDGIYNPLDGDCPLIKGDQAVYLIINDHRSEHGETGGMNLGVEIHTMFYAHDRPDDSALKYTIFAEMKIINRSPNNYSDVYAGHFVDFDLGDYSDDYIGCDSTLESGYVYNGAAIDGEGGNGTYGNRPPAQSFTFLNTELSAFTYCSNASTNPHMTDPQTDEEYYNYMKAIWKDSSNFTYGGTGYGGSQPIRYVFSGDPCTGEGWTEAGAGHPPGDRRGFCTTGPFTLLSGDTLQYDYAMVFARDYQGNNLSSVQLLREYIADVREFYEYTLDVEEPVAEPVHVSIFPNPFKDIIQIGGSFGDTRISYSVFDILGTIVAGGQTDAAHTNRIDLHTLDHGLYFIRLTDGYRTTTRKIIKTQ